MWIEIAFPILGYVLGAIPFGLLIGRVKGVDLRQVGSGNIGATNVARNLGMRFGLVALLLDTLKGFVPTILARLLLSDSPNVQLIMGTTMLAAVLGHMFTIFLGFRGGKGVATALGSIFAVCPLAGLVGMACYVGLYATFHISSVGSFSLVLSAPIVMLLFGVSREVLYTTLIIAVLIVTKHIPNIKRLIAGEEKKVH